MPSPKRQPPKPAASRRTTTSVRKSEPKKSTSSRTRKPSGGVLASSALTKWNWNRISLERKLDILGVILALTGLLTLLSMLSSQHAPATGLLVLFTNRIAGLGSFILPITLIIIGVWLVLRNVERLRMLSAERITGIILIYLNALAWLHLLFGGGWELAEAGEGGGYIGASFERVLVGALGEAGAIIALIGWSLVAIALTLDISVSELFSFLQQVLASLARRINNVLSAEYQARSAARQARQNMALNPPNQTVLELPPDFQPIGQGNQNQPVSTTTSSTRISLVDLSMPHKENETAAPTPGSRVRSSRNTSTPGADQAAATSANPAKADSAPVVKVGKTPTEPPWKLPALSDILAPPLPETIKSNQDVERGKLIEETLASFGTPVRVVEVQRGPTVTQFGVEPLYIETRSGRTRVRVSKIVALSDDLALALAAPRIRIQAPVPGRNYVGIEVPNLEVTRVVLRNVLESDAFRKIKSPLRFALGKDVSGHSKAYDLASMPHLLIAGTTGAGKSVLVNAILSSFLLNNTPTSLRMILVDPKRVELTGYNGIPHLLAPVIVEAEQVVGALQWVQREMDARYHRFSQVGARNISDYNARNEPALPYMLVLVDELADLMMLAPDETERSLTRLAQLARATGIHLVLATQRPSVDVVTGLIKANFPARVAFAVASGIDSRVILDQPGAERLLGRGDMLFHAPDAAAPIRLQGVFVDDSEIQRLVEYWRQQAYEMRDVNLHTPTATPVNMDMPINAPLKQTPLFGDDISSSGDPIFPEAVKIVRSEGKASISMLQRKLRIGYTRSARLIDKLEEEGIIGPALPTSQVREILDFGEEKSAETDNHIEP